jgi:hypothetical protein
MKVTADDLAPMANWISKPHVFPDHAVSFGFHKDVPGAPDLNLGDSYSGTLTFTEGKVGSVDSSPGVPTFPGGKHPTHSTHSTLSGTGQTGRHDGEEVDISIDVVTPLLGVTFRGKDFRHMSSRGPFEKYKESEGFLEFTFQEGGDLYTLYLKREGTGGTTVPKGPIKHFP